MEQIPSSNKMESKRSSEDCPKPMDDSSVSAPLSSTSSMHDLDKDNLNCRSRVDKDHSGKVIKFYKKSANKSNDTASCIKGRRSSSTCRYRKVPWTYYFQQNKNGNTLLHRGIIKGKTKLVLSLIQAVSDPSFLNIQNNSMETPLHIAASMEQEDVMKSLVCAGADISLFDKDGRSAMHIAVMLGHLAGVKALMAPMQNSLSLKKLLADLYNMEGDNCLHIATYLENIEILTYLVNSVFANIDAKNVDNGDTCLHLASVLGNEEFVLALLNLGADPCSINNQKLTPYELAKDSGHFTIQRHLALRGGVIEYNMDSIDYGYHSDY